MEGSKIERLVETNIELCLKMISIKDNKYVNTSETVKGLLEIDTKQSISSNVIEIRFNKDKDDNDIKNLLRDYYFELNQKYQNIHIEDGQI